MARGNFRFLPLLLGLALPGAAAQTQDRSVAEFNNQGSQYFAAHHYPEAQRYFEQALQVAGPADLTAVYNNLAAVYRAQSRYPEAEATYRQAMESADPHTVGNTHLIRALLGLSLTFLDEGKLSAAESCGRRAVALGSESDDGDLLLAEARNDLATVHLSTARYDEAETLSWQVLSALPKEEWGRYAVCANALNTLGRIQLARNDGKAAEPYFTTAASILEGLHGAHDPGLAEVWSNLGKARTQCREWKPAGAALYRAVTVLQEVYGDDHPQTASALTNLAAFYESRKRYKEARPLYQRALEIDTRLLGADAAKTAIDLNNVGELSLRQHRFNDAEKKFVEALAIDQRCLGENHSSTGLLAANLAALYLSQKRYSEARPLLQRAVTIRELNYGPEDPELAALLSEYALALRITGNFVEAERADVQAAHIQLRNALRGRL